MTNKYDKRLKECLKYLYLKTGEDDINSEKYAENAVDYMNSKGDKVLKKDIDVCILKGGSYKIKGYYLENNTLKDIRGASVLLTHVEETVVPDVVKSDFDESCIIYCGGGNIFALVPGDTDENYALKLEETAQKYLVSANIAYCVSRPIKLSLLLGKEYKRIISENESELNERKKLKIIDSIESESEIDDVCIDGAKIEIEKTSLKTGETCKNCGKRIALYKNISRDNMPICAGCLHKNLVGNAVKNKKYLDEYCKYTNKQADSVKALEDIDKEHIAIVYGDGNNMGGIIQTLETITDMMKFSDTVKTAANESVFKAMEAAGITKFEIVGLGGDDVFVIVPAKKAIMFSKYLIEKYYEIFDKEYGAGSSTMSVGIAIAKTSTPVKIILEAAEEKLAEAKSLSKNSDNDKGSMSFTILDSHNDNESRVNTTTSAVNTLLPYSIQTANDILKFVDYIYNYNSEEERLASKSRIRNLSDAFENAESYEEASLFFQYMNAKFKKTDKKTNAVSGVITLPEVFGYKTADEYKGYYIDEESKLYYIWDDLINLLEYVMKGEGK